MKARFISNNDADSVVVQCACVGHCAYIEFFKLFDNNLFMSISTNTRKNKYIKHLDIIEQRFNLNVSQQKTFVDMLTTIENTYSNTFSIKNINNVGDLYIRFEYIKLNENAVSKYDQVQITFYTKYKYFQKNMPDFDIVISRPMLKNLVKTLNEICNLESPD